MATAAIRQLDTENADRNLTSEVTVLTHTVTSGPALCVGVVKLGDGTKNLSGAGGAFLMNVTVGGQTIQPSEQSITFGTATRAQIFTAPFPVLDGEAVVLKVKSPNGADTDVDQTDLELFAQSREELVCELFRNHNSPPNIPSQCRRSTRRPASACALRWYTRPGFRTR